MRWDIVAPCLIWLQMCIVLIRICPKEDRGRLFFAMIISTMVGGFPIVAAMSEFILKYNIF